MSTALVLLAEGFEEIEAVTVIDILRRGGVEVTAASLAEDVLVAGSRGIRVAADAPLSAVASPFGFDAVILPGGAAGTRNLRSDGRVAELLRETDEAGRCVAAICAAPIALGAAGVIRGRRFTCYPSCEGEIAEERHVAGEEVVEDGNLVTSRGPGTAQSFAVALVRRLQGDATARRVAEGLHGAPL